MGRHNFSQPHALYDSLYHCPIKNEGLQSAPGATHIFVTGQHTSPFLQSPSALQKTPGLVGLRHFFASGQQYVPLSAHGVLQGLPGITQILVSGQHTWPFPHAFLSSLQEVLVGVRHAFASGQQYSEDLQTGAAGVGVPAPIHCTSMWNFPAAPSAHTASEVISLK